ncbi:MAG: Succinate--CoA ligase (GDP-forming) subunit beta [Syntrophomonadaceae bacterium]|nr:Succinate--CoA ligase (GDP-forming) subunit beta [Bacillota bacterium]MBT9146713.1 Succinate--CoA ligase (GDP-forming) subunit beta [Bacillota bacterium]
MPKLHEYQGKKLLREHGILVPEGDVASTPEDVRKIARRLLKTVVIKSQVGATGRFKAGGIRFADNADEAEKVAEELLCKEIKGIKVEKVLVEEKLAIEKEFYAGVIVNDSCKVKGPVLMFSTQGGVDIEEVAAKFPEKIVRLDVDILKGLAVEDVRDLASKLDVPPSLVGPLSRVIQGLYEVFIKYSARSAEINPLVLVKDGKIYPADCRIVIDEASVFKHPELEIDYPRDIGRTPTELERLAWKVEEKDYRGIGYFVQMAMDFRLGEGYIGFHGIGGGGAMLGADALIRHGLKLADYADTSGNPTASKVYRVVKLIFSQPNIDGYILMGAVVANQEQWHHAHALVRALREELENRPNFPVIILIAGNKELESLEILNEGLRGLPARIEVYGRDYVYNVDYIAERMKKLVKEYRSA